MPKKRPSDALVFAHNGSSQLGAIVEKADALFLSLVTGTSKTPDETAKKLHDLLETSKLPTSVLDKTNLSTSEEIEKIIERARESSLKLNRDLSKKGLTNADKEKLHFEHQKTVGFRR